MPFIIPNFLNVIKHLTDHSISKMQNYESFFRQYQEQRSAKKDPPFIAEICRVIARSLSDEAIS